MSDDTDIIASGRAASLRPQPPSAFSRSGIPDATEPDIWAYAKSLGVALIEVAPKDVCFGWNGDDGFSIRATMRTAQEAEAVREIIRHLAIRTLPMHRKMVHADLYGDPAPQPSFQQKIAEMFGATP